MSPSDVNGFDDSDLPGLDDIAPDAPVESDPPIETVESPEPGVRAAERSAEEGSAEPEWSHSDLDEWFKEIGGDQAYWDLFEGFGGLDLTWAPRHPDLWFGMSAYQRLATPDSPRGSWPRLSLEAKIRFRRGWEKLHPTDPVADESEPVLDSVVPSVVPELAPLPPIGFDPRNATPPTPEPVAPDERAASDSSLPRRVSSWLENTSTAARLAAIAVSVVGAVLITLALQSDDGSQGVDVAAGDSPAEVVVGDDELVTDPPAVAVDEPAVAVDEPAVAVDEPAVAVDQPDVVVDEPTTTLETLIEDAVDDAFVGENWVLDPLAIPPLLRTSFLAEAQSAEFFEDALGAVFPITHVNVMRLDVDAGSTGSPLSELFEAISPRVDVALAPRTDNSEPGADLLAVGFRIEGDITDPAVCAGTLLNLVVNVHVPDFGDPYVANPSFPGEYYAGGNVFVNLSLVDCALEHFADGFFGGEIAGGLRPEDAAFLTVDDGATYGLVVLPSPYVDPDGTVRFIFFEHPEGENFVPENTRYQSVPDIVDQPIRVALADTIDFAALIAASESSR